MLMDRLEEPPKVASTDDGNEYAKLATYLKDKGIGHKVSVSDRCNAWALLDRAVQDITQRFTLLISRNGKGDEKLKLEKH